MRFTSVLKKLVGVTQLYVRGLVMDRDDALSIEVTPTWRAPRCAGCGRRAPQYDHPRSIGRWQDLNWGPVRVYLVYRALLTSKWVEVQVGATRSYAIWAVTA